MGLEEQNKLGCSHGLWLHRTTDPSVQLPVVLKFHGGYQGEILKRLLGREEVIMEKNVEKH